MYINGIICTILGEQWERYSRQEIDRICRWGKKNQKENQVSFNGERKLSELLLYAKKNYELIFLK